MELIKEVINSSKMTAKGTTQAMTDGDVIVPDVKPDIIKLLQVDADACITDKYIENGRLVICGRVDYKTIYVPDCENEKINSIDTSMEFRQVVDAGGGDSDCKIIVKPQIERVEFNTVNSRKLRIRAIVNLDYEIIRIVENEICCDTDSDDLEKKFSQLSFEDVVDTSEHEFTIKESIEIPSGSESIREILKADVNLCDIEYKAMTGKVIVKGSSKICVLYIDNDGEVKFTDLEIPFTEVFDCDRAVEDCICDIESSILNKMYVAEPDNDGDLRIMMMEIDVGLSIKCLHRSAINILSDCYYPYKKTDIKTDEIVINSIVEHPEMQNTIREIVDLPQGAPEIKGVYNTMANATILTCEKQRNKLNCSGKIDAYILYLTNSADNPIYSLKKEIPFNYLIECENNTETVDCQLKTSVNHISYNLNSNGSVELRCLIKIEGILSIEERINNIIDVSCDEMEKGGLIVYFSREGESVWNIAKKYSVPVSLLKECNDIEGESIVESARIFIPAT